MSRKRRIISIVEIFGAGGWECRERLTAVVLYRQNIMTGRGWCMDLFETSSWDGEGRHISSVSDAARVTRIKTESNGIYSTTTTAPPVGRFDSSLSILFIFRTLRLDYNNRGFPARISTNISFLSISWLVTLCRQTITARVHNIQSQSDRPVDDSTKLVIFLLVGQQN